ncbi:SAM-dependent methyltransferase [Campylobacter sp. FU_497]|uniref:SAM-dependent methyltransferase n=1 Tax=Campylobacter sp. FU_497 TaxID=2911610 RepID=UPI002987FF89|nr:SAM-dependent methyltransferase [Campylobacter sp. FU_497]
MAFSEFFQNWIDKYYSQAVSVGKNGDFYTAVSVGNLFGVLLAKHFLKLIDDKKLTLPVEVVEIGANEGHLMLDFIQALYTLRAGVLEQIECFVIEPYEKLRCVQKKLFDEYDLDVKIYNSLEECHFKNAFFYANELFDCFACELIKDKTMAYVGDDLNIVFKPMSEELLKECEKYAITNSELCISYKPFLSKLKQTCEKLTFACFDYAKKEEKISIRMYKNHQVYNLFEENLKDFFAKSDITYNVNFDHFLQVLKEEGFEVLEYKNQNQALIDFGLEEIIEQVKNINLQIYKNFISQSKNLMFNFGDKFKFLEFKL